MNCLKGDVHISKVEWMCVFVYWDQENINGLAVMRKGQYYGSICVIDVASWNEFWPLLDQRYCSCSGSVIYLYYVQC